MAIAAAGPVEPKSPLAFGLGSAHVRFGVQSARRGQPLWAPAFRTDILFAVELSLGLEGGSSGAPYPPRR